MMWQNKNRGYIIVGAFIFILILITGLYIRRTCEHNNNVKEFDALSDKNDEIFHALVNDFYANENMSMPHPDRVIYLQHNALPKIKEMQAIAQKFNLLLLPAQQEKIASLKSKMIVQECNIYGMLYKEVAKNDTAYSSAIKIANDSVNILGRQLAKVFHAQEKE